MNQYITASAERELISLLKRTGGEAVHFTVPKDGGIDLKVLFPGDAESAIMLSAAPKVFSDLRTLKALNSASIDFDSVTHEFIFRLKRDEFYSQFRRL